MSDDRTLGEWMRRRRAELDLTRERLAEQVGCAVETIRKIETGQRRPSRQVAELLARALELPPDERAAFVRAARRPPSLSTAASERAPKTKPGEAPAVTAAPTPATSFVGRAAELAAVAELLARPDCRLITLLGPGGIGKTRLALRAIEAPLPFAGGAAFVPLAGVASPELLAPTIAAALGCALHGSRAPLAQLLSYLRERSLLLVLDNLEHLLGHETLNLIGSMLTLAPGVTLLSTSRARLNVQGEAIFPVGGLPVAPSAGLDVSAPSAGSTDAASSAVQLFAQRAADPAGLHARAGAPDSGDAYL